MLVGTWGFRVYFRSEQLGSERLQGFSDGFGNHGGRGLRQKTKARKDLESFWELRFFAVSGFGGFRVWGV